jgi:hypothetical protein
VTDLTCPLHPVAGVVRVRSVNVLYLVVAMLVSLVVAGAVLFYVAYPHRGEKAPGVPWLSDAMERAADAAPVLEEHEVDLLRSR